MTGKRARKAARTAAAADPALETGLPATAGEFADGGASTAGAGRAEAAVRPAKRQADLGAAAVSAGQQLGHSEEPQPDVLSAALENAVVRRTKDGWRVGSDDLPDLTCAMILADLLAAENGMAEETPAKPGGDPAAASEAGRLRTTVGQLEHALLTRIRVEQAIGVLAERHRIKPRQAFEQLRAAARSRGRKVIDIAGDVVASASNPLLQLPDELSRPRSGPRRAARQSFGAQ
ncbi:MAG TPA: ANTAR domain-containing protein [Streptosporangiaceae bacterium]|nr:ANTAR domain-containing protein [Streptosporangiaceae bacterium]